MESQEQGARLEKVRKSLGMNQVKMANAIGISQGYLNQVLTGKRNISYSIINAITQKFPNVNIGWILNGKPGGRLFPEAC